jgi:iron complex outermembrane receptor protein
MGAAAPFESSDPSDCSSWILPDDQVDLRHARPTCASLALAFALLSAPAHAQVFGPDAASPGEGATAADIVVSAHAFREGEIGKSDIPLLETPQAISIVTAEQIKARGITDLNDALRGVAGVSYSNTYGYYDAYTIRGYDTAYDSLYLDGLIASSTDGSNNELAGLERIEVLKGPASMLYGSGPIGGIVNLVSKRPQDRAFLDMSVATGSYNLFEAALDANAPLNRDGTLLARINVLYRDAGDFIKFSGENRLFIAPSLTWNIAPQTHLTLQGRWQRDHDNPWTPLPAEGTVLPNANGQIPYGFAASFPGSQRAINNQDRKSIGYIFDHKFSDALSFTSTARYTHGETYWNNWSWPDEYVGSNYVNGIQQSHVLGLYIYGPFYRTTKELGTDNRLSLEVTTGRFTHQFLAGFEYRWEKSNVRDEGGNFDATVNTLDYLNPNYNITLIHDPSTAYSDATRGNRKGLYLQDHIGFDEKLFLTVGGRWDWVSTNGAKSSDFSPRVGVNYFVDPQTSLYASWSRSFAPQFSWVQSFDGTPLPNGHGDNKEVGLKFGSSDNRFSGSMAVFELVRTNVVTADPLHPGFSVVTGKQRSQGAEIEAVWQPADGASLSLAYAFLNAKVVEDNSIPVGTRLGNVPKHNLYLRGDYEVQDGALKGLGASLSVLWNSAKLADTTYVYDADGDGDNDAAFRLPGYVVVDAGLSYKLNDWTARVHVNNLFDRHYYPSASYYSRVNSGEPRSWRLSLARRF